MSHSAIATSRPSLQGGPTSCSEAGRPPSRAATGKAMAGSPARFASAVKSAWSGGGGAPCGKARCGAVGRISASAEASARQAADFLRHLFGQFARRA